MTARDEFPLERHEPHLVPVLYTIDPGRWKDMCDEIDRLRDEQRRRVMLGELFGPSNPPGNPQSWADIVDQLRAENERLTARLASGDRIHLNRDGARPHKFPRQPDGTFAGDEVLGWECQACGEWIREFGERTESDCPIDWRYETRLNRDEEHG